MPTQRKSAKSSRKSSSKSSSKKPASQSPSSSRSRKGASSSGSSSGSSRKTQSRAGARGRSPGSGRTSAAKRSSGAPRGKTPNAIELLTQDHRNVQKMFRKAARMDSDDRQLQEIVGMTCAALTQHAEIEEQLLYPALQEHGKDQDLVQEALVEHDSAKQLITQLEGMDPGDERYKATFKVLGEYVNHHIEEEESRIFREARRAKIDVEALGEQILMLKQGGDATAERAESTSRASGGGSSAPRASGRGPSQTSSTSRGRAGAGRSSSRQGDSAGDSRALGDEDGSQSALDDETESAAMTRTGGDTTEDTERPGRGGRRARSVGEADDEDEIDVETPGSSRFGSH